MYRHALAMVPEDDIQGRNIILNQLGITLSEQSRYAEAEEAHAEQLALMPDDAPGWSNRANNQERWARADLRAGRRDSAREHADRGLVYSEKALAINPHMDRWWARNRALHQLRDEL
jgi:tetratricopeptide (TPR) repeat protein